MKFSQLRVSPRNIEATDSTSDSSRKVSLWRMFSYRWDDETISCTDFLQGYHLVCRASLALAALTGFGALVAFWASTTYIPWLFTALGFLAASACCYAGTTPAGAIAVAAGLALYGFVAGTIEQEKLSCLARASSVQVSDGPGSECKTDRPAR